LGILGKRDNIRVNCLAPGWIAVPEVQAYVDSLNPEQHAQRGVPNTLITIDEIADAVVQLATDETLAGRVIVWWNDEPPGFIPVGDPGYERLE
jgi:NAD(P)-dependent dehydrogenase (short-subunit alcohol dehydrogenase family)